MSEQKNKSTSAFGGLFWVIIILAICLAAWVSLPNYISIRHVIGPAGACINNFRQIEAAANQFALEYKLTNGSPINFPNDLTPYIKLNREGKNFPCPQGGVYHISKVGETPTCSLGTTVTPAHILP